VRGQGKRAACGGMSMHTYIYTHIHTYTHTLTHTHTSTHTHSHTHSHTFTHSHTHPHTPHTQVDWPWGNVNFNHQVFALSCYLYCCLSCYLSCHSLASLTSLAHLSLLLISLTHLPYSSISTSIIRETPAYAAHRKP
jgi:hypothetical protein